MWIMPEQRFEIKLYLRANVLASWAGCRDFDVYNGAQLDSASTQPNPNSLISVVWHTVYRTAKSNVAWLTLTLNSEKRIKEETLAFFLNLYLTKES